MTAVMLVDSRMLVREGLCALIEKDPSFAVVAQAGTVEAAGRHGVEPDIITTDVELPDARHAGVISGLRSFFPRTPILVLTSVSHPAKVQSVIANGANGYLLHTASPADFFTGLRALADGESYLQPSLGVELARWHRTRETAAGLSLKEEQVLKLLALGHTNAEIADICELSVRTVETHRAHLHEKLGRRTRAELVQYAREVGLDDLDPE